MPRVSVVVPIYNVERYLEECLDSLEAQTFEDLEVVMVNDGSTDRSPAIAERYAARDSRFRLVSQPNGGLSAARNTGFEAARGEFLAFVDSDDVVSPRAYELLVGALDKTGSDFATGEFHRLMPHGTSPWTFAREAFRETRMATHVTKFRPLLADRTAWNKLWRRSFWDSQGYRFPEGMIFEDTPVVVPAHFAARSVDVVAEPVYYWRVRGGTDLSITQRRLERKALADRLTAIEKVVDHLDSQGERKGRRWYLESVIADDLRYYVNVLDAADEEYRELFLDRVGPLLDRAGRRVFKQLPAIDRLKWHLVRRRLLPQLDEVLRFHREELQQTPPVRVRGRWYGDYPFRTDRALRIPRSVYRLGQELVVEAGVEALDLRDGRLGIRGWAYVDPVGAPEQRTQRVTVTALRPGRLRRVRIRLTPRRARARTVRRDDVAAHVRRPVADPTWSGFEAALNLHPLLRAARGKNATWELFVTVRVRGARRHRMRFRPTRPLRVRAVEREAKDDTLLRSGPAPGRTITVEVQHDWARLRGQRVQDGVLELHGDLRLEDVPKLRLEIAREGTVLGRYPVEVGGGAPRRSFTVRLPLAELREKMQAAPPVPDGKDPDEPWLLELRGGGRRLPVALSADGDGGASRFDGLEAAVFRTDHGNAGLAIRPPRPLLTDARWTEEATLEVEVDPALAEDVRGLLVAGRVSGARHELELRDAGPGGRLEARLDAARVPSLAGPLPLSHDIWGLCARTGDDVPVMVDPRLYERLPLTAVAERKPLTLTATRYGRAEMFAGPDLDEDERGRFHELRLRRSVYTPARTEPLRDAVVYSSFGGLQYSDSPRAIHEELVRRGAPLEHLWIVRDVRCRVPDTATVVRYGSREYHEALARARYVVFNDHFPEWFRRRPDQVCVQTWHGTPLKRLGFEAADKHGRVRRFEREVRAQPPNWQYVVSPNRFSTPILRRAYAVEGEMLETGYPRDDLLASADEAGRRRVRERIGVPEDARAVLYAPTYRDDAVDNGGRPRFEPALDLAQLRDAAGPDTFVLVRKHPYAVGTVPTGPDGLVRDVSTYPDATELLLGVDVLVTDYASLMFDFANTGRPMLFFAYDFDAYAEAIRGFSFDFASAAPGPLLRTADELADALPEADAIRAEYDGRYAEFTRTFCEFDDGSAAARVVDGVFEW